MRVLTGLLVLFTALSACSVAEEAKSDFDVFCGAFTALAALSKYQEMNPLERNTYLEAEAKKNTSLESNAFITWVAVSSVEPSMRYPLFQEAAKASLKTDWDCTAMQRKSAHINAF
ncbi:MAG: hypothetical protein ACI93R_003779 [Flavobacteriales bacterium]|jgi:hypothetical protein